MVNQGPPENPKRAPSHDTDGVFHMFDRVFKKKQGPYVEVRQREKLKKQLAKQKQMKEKMTTRKSAKFNPEKLLKAENGPKFAKKDLLRLQEMFKGKKEK